MTRDEVHAWVRAYADTFDAPVAQGVEVVRVEQRPEGGFTVVTSAGVLTADFTVQAMAVRLGTIYAGVARTADRS